ncbi:MAG: ubiquinol-cytochrome c reductase iron-sulfur subunit [Candidatus Zixiibacteriota bacterium]
MKGRALQENNISRRSFIKWITGGAIVAFLGSVLFPVIKFIIPPESGEANVSQLKLPFGRAEIEAEPQKSKTFKFGRSLGIIIVTPEGELKALSATCTHLDCTVQHRPDLGIIWCSCHNGRYDLNGNNISGPPPKPLEKYIVNEVEDEISIAREMS